MPDGGGERESCCSGLGGLLSICQSNEGKITNFIAEHQGSIARLSCERELCTSGFEFSVGWWVKIQGGAGGDLVV